MPFPSIFQFSLPVKHIDMITKKAFSRVNILRKFKFILDRKTLETIYINFIRPLLEYADVVCEEV
jgi:hypothetical protein